MPGRCSQCSGGHHRITCRWFYDWKNREDIGIHVFLTWPNSTPIADWRRRIPADNPGNHPIIGWKWHFSPKNPTDQRLSLYVTLVLAMETYIVREWLKLMRLTRENTSFVGLLALHKYQYEPKFVRKCLSSISWESYTHFNRCSYLWLTC